MSLKNKKVLITAGPTWVPIDNVRVISNIATGITGILLAEKLQALGAKVTLLLGHVESPCLNNKIRLIRFKSFDELKNLIKRELESKKYEIVIHSAAVSDYRIAKSYSYKIKSGIRDWKLKLVPTIKIIDLIRRIGRSLFLVGFKFEPAATKDILIKQAKRLMERFDLDLAVANSINRNRYTAYILESRRTYGPILNKKDLAQELANIIGEKI